MPNTQTGARERIARFLPRALENALASYKQIAAKIHGCDVKSKKQHDACKVALAHVELLLKLARWVESTGGSAEDDGVDHKTLQSLIENAQKELRGDE